MIRFAAVTLLSCHTRLALTAAMVVALGACGTYFIAVARDACSIRTLIKVATTLLAVGAVCIACAIETASAMTGLLKQLGVIFTAGGAPIAVAWQAFVGIGASGPPPGPVVVKGQALLAVGSVRVVLAAAGLSPFLPRALARVPVAFTPSTHSEIRDGVIVGFQNFGIAKDFVAERVESVQRDAYVRGGDPLLQDGAVLEVVGAGASLQGAEGHVAPRQGRDIAVLDRAQGPRLVVRQHVRILGEAVRIPASGAVILVRNPGPIFGGTLVDGKTLGTRRMEHETHVRDIEGFAQMQRQVDVIGILHPLQHSFALPVGQVVVVVEVRQELGAMGQFLVAGVAVLARLLGVGGPRLVAVLRRAVSQAARVRRFHQDVEGSVHELGDAPDRSPALVVALADPFGLARLAPAQPQQPRQDHQAFHRRPLGSRRPARAPVFAAGRRHFCS